MGYSSGTAAIEAEGLQGAVSLLFTTLGSTDAVAQALGTQEALGGAIGLNTQAAKDFGATFEAGLTGATDAARAIQMESAAAQFDLLKSSLLGAGISISGALLPPLVAAAQAITPLITQVATANPALIQMGVAVAAVAASIGPLAVGIGFLLSPVGLLVAGIAGIMYAANALYPGGIVQLFADASASASMLGEIGMAALNRGLEMGSNLLTMTVIPGWESFWGAIKGGWALIQPTLTALYDDSVRTFNFLGGIGLLVSAGLTPISDWFNVQGGAIVGWLTNATDNVLTAFSGWFREAAPYVLGFWTMLSDNVTAAVNIVTGLIDGLIAKINSIPAVGNIGTGAAAIANIGASGASRDVIWNAIAAEFGWGGARAEGGPVMGGSAYLVGERGPELFVPQGNGTIIPNGAGGGGMNVNVQLTVTEGNARNAGLSFAEGLMDRYRALA